MKYIIIVVVLIVFIIESNETASAGWGIPVVGTSTCATTFEGSATAFVIWNSVGTATLSGDILNWETESNYNNLRISSETATRVVEVEKIVYKEVIVYRDYIFNSNYSRISIFRCKVAYYSCAI